MSPSLHITSDPSLLDSSPAVIVRVERHGLNGLLIEPRKDGKHKKEMLDLTSWSWWKGITSLAVEQDLIYKKSSALKWILLPLSRIAALCWCYTKRSKKRQRGAISHPLPTEWRSCEPHQTSEKVNVVSVKIKHSVSLVSREGRS